MEIAAHHLPVDALAQSSCWEALDGVVCINLDRRIDRWEQFQQAMSSVIPLDKIHRLSAVVGVELPGFGHAPWFSDRTGERRTYWAGVAGCMLSHAKAIKLAQQSGWRNVLIFEDDVQAKVTHEGLQMMARALQRLRGRYLMYLGYNKPIPCGVCMEKEAGAELWRTSGALAAHAYIVPQCMYEPLLAALPERQEDAWAWIARHRAVDTFYRDEVSEWSGVSIYAVLPLMFYQSGASSDLLQTTDSPGQPEYEGIPRRLGRLGNLAYHICAPLRKLKVYLNSRRTYYRAKRGGFPGFRKKRAQK